MPIYEYSCGECGDDFELLVFKSDEPACPKCGSKDLQKKMSACGFSVGYKFKGSFQPERLRMFRLLIVQLFLLLMMRC